MGFQNSKLKNATLENTPEWNLGTKPCRVKVLKVYDGDTIWVAIKLKGCILMIDYGYLRPNNQNTLQSVMKHQKNSLLNNLGKADITSHVNFSLLNEFFLKNNFKIKDIITQKQFLENMGILERAKIIAKKMKFSEQSNLYLRLKRLLSPKLMGNLFKVILAYKLSNNNFAGFK